MDELDNAGGDAGGGEGGEQTLDIGETLANIVAVRGENLGDGKAPPEDTTDPEPEGRSPADGQPAPESAKPAAPAQGDPAPGERRPPDLTKAPASWKPEIGAKWDTLPLEVKAEVHRREEDAARWAAEVKPQLEVGKKLAETLRPYEADLRQYNIDPFVQINNLMGAHRVLALGTPEQKQQMLQTLIREYKIPLGSLTAPEEEGWVDPQVKALREELNGVKTTLQSHTQAQLEQRRQEYVREIQAFSSDKAANPHFEEVAGKMAELLKASQGKTLREAYDEAVWLVPTVREKLVTERAEAARKEREKADREEAEKAARLKSLHLRSRSKPAVDTDKTGTINDTLKDTYAAIAARDK